MQIGLPCKEPEPCMPYIYPVGQIAPKNCSEDRDVPTAQTEEVASQQHSAGLVLLHVYDVATSGGITSATQRLNTAMMRLPGRSKSGAFHAAVEVNGIEWSFGRNGIFCNEPGKSDEGHHRRVIAMGITQLSPREIEALIDALRFSWQGWSYNLLRKNCCGFSNELCIGLGVGEIPHWVGNLAQVGARVANMIAVTNEVRQVLTNANRRDVQRPGQQIVMGAHLQRGSSRPASTSESVHYALSPFLRRTQSDSVD
mmetsp:Transcript_27301/g.45517  ORF Transcript_27301/g.45517 Transcript_27301/m.45517 type:complete len:255 (-) Transcript_27301:15-779(-)